MNEMDNFLERCNRILGILAGIVTIGALSPFFLTLLGIDWFHNVLKIRRAEVFGEKGYVYYSPLLTNPTQNASWYLVSSRKEMSFDSLKQGDILKVGGPENPIKVGPNKDSRKSSFLKQGECVIVLSDKDKESAPPPFKLECGEKPDPGGWVYVARTTCI